MPRPKGSRNKKGTKAERETNQQLNTGDPGTEAEVNTTPAEVSPNPTEPPVEVIPASNDDIFSTEIPVAVNPLATPLIDKKQSTIPPPPPPADKTLGKEKKKNTTEGFKPSTGTSSPKPEPPKSPQEIKEQAEQSAEFFWKVYEKMHAVIRYLGKVNLDEATQEHLENKINLDQVLPFGKQGKQQVKLRDFLQEINTTIDTDIVVSKELKTKLNPAIVRICIKRGWLLSDEYYVASVLVDDLTYKVSILHALKSSASMIMESCRVMLSNQNTIIKQNDELRKKGQMSESAPPTPPAATPTEDEHSAAETSAGAEAISAWATETTPDGKEKKIEVEKV